MSLISRRINSFSLVEMLIVLVLSSMVISIIYLAYYNITTYQINLSRKQEAMHDLSSLYFLLRKDMERSETVYAMSPVDIQCSQITGIGTVQYVFFEEDIIRRQGTVMDTFKCRITDPHFMWRSKDIEKFPGKIDEITFTLQTHQPVKVAVFKQYDVASRVETKRDTLP